MWRSGSDSGTEQVACVACGAEVERDEAREYDKHGDRWERRDKEFEFLCKPCYRECCHQPRGSLESDLVRAEAGDVDRETFFAQFHEVVTDGTHEEREHEQHGYEVPSPSTRRSARTAGSHPVTVRPARI